MAVGTFPKQIYFNAQNKMEVGVKVGNAGVAVVGGKKILKAGTPLAGNLENRSVKFTQSTSEGETSDAVGVLVHDVDVTDGDTNATMCIFGFVNLDRLETDVVAKIDDKCKAALGGKVWFLKDN